jgi:hypothetical protein
MTDIVPPPDRHAWIASFESCFPIFQQYGGLHSSLDSVKAAASQVAADLLTTFYHANTPGGIPGILDGPPTDGNYYWWTGAAVWGTLIDLRS